MELAHGKLSDSALTKQLRLVVTIRPEIIKMLPVLGIVRLYDHEPPLPLMTQLMYNSVAESLSADEFREQRVNGVFEKKVKLTDLQSLLSRYAFPVSRESEIVPKAQWLQRGLDVLAKLKWVRIEQKEIFVFILKRRSKTYERFLNACAKTEDREKRKAHKREEKRLRVLKKAQGDTPLLDMIEG